MTEDTRLAIIDSAINVFNEDFSATLEKVAERAGVTRRTLHRYFKDRKELMDSCECAVLRACFTANHAAYHASDDPMQKLKNMFYAGMDCGIKYTFLHKIHHLDGHAHHSSKPNCSDFDKAFNLWKDHLLFLQGKGMISTQLTVEWIQLFFRGIVSASVQAQDKGTPVQESRKFAWYSFSKGIGV
jgi:AcrR family transcriptional regulator